MNSASSTPGRRSFSLHDVTAVHSIDDLRPLMPVTQHQVYLDHAALSPIPQPTVDAICAWAADAATSGVLHWKYWQTRIRQTRELAASLLGAAAADDVAFVSSTAAGIAVAAEGYPWQPGDNVVVPLTEFPSNLFPWLNLQSRGVEVRRVEPVGGPTDINGLYQAVQQACDERTRVVACSWVDYISGQRRDLARLAEIAHKHQAMFVVDAIQGLGVLDLDVEQCQVDVLVADSRKWLLGTDGTALLYVRPQWADQLRVLGPGWNSVSNPTEFECKELLLKSNATRFETGVLNTCGIAALYASLKLLSEIPLIDRQSRVLQLRQELADAAATVGLSDSCSGSEMQSGILSLDCADRDPAALASNLRRQGIVVSVRGGRLRVSPHLYTNSEDVQRFVAGCEMSSD